MTSRDFCYWLQGYFEIAGNESGGMTPKQMGMVKKHLALVFKHEIDPSYGDEEHQEELNRIHGENEQADPRSHRRDNGPVLYKC